MKSENFLFELGVEELPSHAVKFLSEELAKNISAGFKSAEIKHGTVHAYGSPRRIAVVIKYVSEITVGQKITKKGPSIESSIDANNNPSKSLLGFAKSCGVTLAELSKLETDKGQWWIYESEEKPLKTEELLLPIVKKSVAELPIQKVMTWGEGGYQFSRPVHWAVMMFGKNIIDGEIFGLKLGNDTFGHRFHHPSAIAISAPENYEAQLIKGKVIADFAERREIIRQQIEQIAFDNQLVAIIPDSLLEEVTSIVEWPKAVLASFDAKFLNVPEEALIESMQHHQKCFALRDSHGKLSPYFIFVTNIESKNLAKVIVGNEKVMRARLSDGAFFFEQDKKDALIAHLKEMEKVVFHAKLGSLADKTKRMIKIMDFLANALNLDSVKAKRATELAKCDLLTGMVGEFPELQGLMGYYYAKHDNEAEEVAVAIRDHYLPKFAADNLPEDNLSKALSLADRIDTIVGLFASGQKPTGVKDPFKLRRHALAIARVLITLSSNISLTDLISRAIDAYDEIIPGNSKEIIEPLKTFILERMLSFYQTKDIDPQFLNAVIAVQNDRIFDMNNRVDALRNFVNLPEASDLAAACKRVSNLVEKSDISFENQEVKENLFTENAERLLFKKIIDIENLVDSFKLNSDYASILNGLATFQKPLASFFEYVMVMVDNPEIKFNRLNLLHRLQKLLQSVADISLLNF
ncbi:MAG: glycine--tRNA ligase subunit beta [Legionellales bacterium RIFCSPHIGHO2_12_FULL_35_11]|nr:MAG: glycine--tRNA ligase subunit beta [Legionellales bacterium RIFCSPHIGHO2_12_FULL_35_11]